MEDLVTLDFSHNKLKAIPKGMAAADGLVVLALSHNQIESLPSSLLTSCTDLEYLDVAYNEV